jgi:hypothetical protein
MKKSLLTIFQYLFFLGLGGFFVWLTVRDISNEQWLQIKNSLRQARHWLIIPVALMLLGSHYIRAIRWKILMEPLGYKPSTFNTFAAVMIGYLVNAGVPRLGEVVKCTILARYEQVRADRLVGTIVVERAVDLVCLIVVFLAALVFQGHIIGQFTMDLMGDVFMDKTGGLSVRRILIAVIGLALVTGVLFFVLRKFAHVNAVGKIKNAIKGIVHGLNSIRLVKHKGWFIFHTVLIWGLYLFSTTVGMYALKETQHLGIGAGLTALFVGSIGMIMTPNGIGAYALLVSQLMGEYGLDVKTIGTALGWLLWSVQTLIVIGGGLVFFGLFSYYNKKRKKIANGEQHQPENIDIA